MAHSDSPAVNYSPGDGLPSPAVTEDQLWRFATEQGPLVVLLTLFIGAAFRGWIRFAREFKSLEETNARLTAVVAENTSTTSTAVKALGEAVLGLKAMTAEFEHLQNELAQTRRELEERRRR